MCTVGVCLLSVVDKLFLQFLYIPEWLFAVTWDPPVPLYPPESSCGTSEGKGGISEHTLSQTLSLQLELCVFRAAGLQRGYKEEWPSTVNHYCLYLYVHICHLAVG